MFKKLLAAIGINSAATAASSGQDAGGPYKDDAANLIYQLLFCDRLRVFTDNYEGKIRPTWSDLFADKPDFAALRRIADDKDQESRVRMLAFNLLRAAKKPVPKKELLGTIIEYRLPDGLDTLADQRRRYHERLSDHFPARMACGRRWPWPSIPETLIDDCVRLCCSLCLLESDPSVIEPNVLSKDWDKFEAGCDDRCVDTAHRRGKIGWNVGRHIEIAPHDRRPHMALVWMEGAAAGQSIGNWWRKFRVGLVAEHRCMCWRTCRNLKDCEHSRDTHGDP